ncbi:MAG: hypothetical protein OXD42_02935 [Rhodospirillaceae bacterium]|nr:hypothetical protein [Rhodospirillaceae bacterium]
MNSTLATPELKGADTVLVTGAGQSNFGATAAASRKVGTGVHIQLESRLARRDQDCLRSGNVLLDTLLGTTLHQHAGGDDEVGANHQLEEIADSLKQNGQVPYVICLRPDHPPLGALGYVVAAEELVKQPGGAGDTAR